MFITPEDQATFICYGICLLMLILVFGGLYIESRSMQKRAHEALEEEKLKENQ